MVSGILKQPRSKKQFASYEIGYLIRGGGIYRIHLYYKSVPFSSKEMHNNVLLILKVDIII